MGTLSTHHGFPAMGTLFGVRLYFETMLQLREGRGPVPIAATVAPGPGGCPGTGWPRLDLQKPHVTCS